MSQTKAARQHYSSALFASVVDPSNVLGRIFSCVSQYCTARHQFLADPKNLRLWLLFDMDIYRTRELCQLLPLNLYDLPLVATGLSLSRDGCILRLEFKNPLLEVQQKFYDNPELCRSNPGHRDFRGIPQRKFLSLKMELCKFEKPCKLNLADMEKHVGKFLYEKFAMQILDQQFTIESVFTEIKRGTDIFVRQLDVMDRGQVKQTPKKKSGKAILLTQDQKHKQ